MGCHGLMSSALQVAVFGVTLIGAGIAFAPRAGQGRVPVIAAICVLVINSVMSLTWTLALPGVYQRLGADVVNAVSAVLVVVQTLLTLVGLGLLYLGIAAGRGRADSSMASPFPPPDWPPPSKGSWPFPDEPQAPSANRPWIGRG